LSGSFSEQNSIWGTGINLSGYSSTTFAQFVVGGSINKAFSKNDFVDNNLPAYQVSGFISANKPLADRYLASLSFSVNDAFSKASSDSQFKTNYAVSSSLSYVVNQSFQVAPSISYSFGDGNALSFGVSVAYIGGW